MSTDFSLIHRTCKLVVLLCVLHITVTVFFYVRTMDIRFSFVQNQQSRSNSTQPKHVLLPIGSPRTEPTGNATQRKEQLDELDQNPTEEPRKQLEKCPETSPLLGESGSEGLGS